MKQPFTPEGAANVLAALYNLSDVGLANEAASFTQNLKAWLSANFELNTHQINYLQQLNQSATDYYAQLGGFALQNRLPIHLDIAAKTTDPPVDEEDEDDEQGKIVYTKNSLNALANEQGKSTATGELTFCIRY